MGIGGIGIVVFPSVFPSPNRIRCQAQVEHSPFKRHLALSLSDPQVRTREVNAMTEALDEQKLGVGLVLTESEREDIVLGKLKIKVRPLAVWLCDLDE
jgi:hypothetical protein